MFVKKPAISRWNAQKTQKKHDYAERERPIPERLVPIMSYTLVSPRRATLVPENRLAASLPTSDTPEPILEIVDGLDAPSLSRDSEFSLSAWRNILINTPLMR